LEGAGAELYLDSRSLKAAFPWVSPDAVAGVYVRCAGWLAAQQLGMMLFEQAQAAGAEFLSGELLEPDLQGGKLGGIWVRFSNRIERIETPSLIVATGPLLPDLLERWGFPLPLETEAHFKVIFDDFEKRLPRPSPLVIWSDPIQLAWSAELLREIAADVTLRFLLDPLPGGIHFRPEGGVDSTRSLLLWNFQATPGPFVTDPQPPDHHVPVVLHGIARIVPGFEVYLESARKPFVDGGFYTLAPDELPVLGSLRPGLGIHVLGAFGGYGIMTAFAAAELVVQELLGLPLPSWSAAFHPSRFADPAYRSETQGPSAKL
jgi:glycine/D-amino acid oxidase-like deaminating enzyme